eukprot:1140879-Pelagomonas_calceolata.AAC.6
MQRLGSQGKDGPLAQDQHKYRYLGTKTEWSIPIHAHQRLSGCLKVQLLRCMSREDLGEGELLHGEGLEHTEKSKKDTDYSSYFKLCVKDAKHEFKSDHEQHVKSCQTGNTSHRLAFAGGSSDSPTSEVALIASSILSAATPTPLTEEGRSLTNTCMGIPTLKKPVNCGPND